MRCLGMALSSTDQPSSGAFVRREVRRRHGRPSVRPSLRLGDASPRFGLRPYRPYEAGLTVTSNSSLTRLPSASSAVTVMVAVPVPVPITVKVAPSADTQVVATA